MTTLRTAAQQALEALETNNQAWKNLADSGDAGFWEAEEQPFYETSVKAITALKEALVEDAMQKFTDVNQELEAALAEPEGGGNLPPPFPVKFDHAIGADRFKVVRGAFWWHVLIGDSPTEHGKFRSRASAEKMAADLLREFRNGAFVQHEAALAKPVLNPAPGYCKHCKQYTIEEPLPAEPVQEPVAYIHRQGNHWEVSERELVDDERARGWTEEPLYTAPRQRPVEPVQEPVCAHGVGKTKCSFCSVEDKQPVQEPVAGRAFLERILAAMEGVIDIADRKTDEFDALRSCVIDLTLMLHTAPPQRPAEPVQETGVKLKPVFYAPRRLDDEEVEDIIKRNAAITESILDIDRKEPQPGMVNLDAFRAFHFNDPPKGGFVGEIEMLKWLVRNRDGDYWKAKYGVQEPPCAPSECPNCASLQDQNTELDRKLAEMERKPMNEFDALRLVTESIGSLQSAGPVEGLIGIIRAVERAHGIT